jgi:hypothetical protein
MRTGSDDIADWRLAMVDLLVIGDWRLTIGEPSINNQQPLNHQMQSPLKDRQSTMLI